MSARLGGGRVASAAGPHFGVADGALAGRHNNKDFPC